MEGLKVSNSDLVVYIHPSKSKVVRDAIYQEMSSLLFKFNEVFDGVVLAYEVIAQSESAKILSGIHPYFGVKLKAKLLLFSPKPDMLLEGKVVKLGNESIHLVVLGFSSASITEEDIRQEFRHKIKHGKEVYASKSHKRHVIKVGSMVRFLVKSLDEEILHISGSLIPSNTGTIEWLERHNEEVPQPERRVKKRKSMESESEMIGYDPGCVDGDALDKSHGTKSKRRRSSELFF